MGFGLNLYGMLWESNFYKFNRLEPTLDASQSPVVSKKVGFKYSMSPIIKCRLFLLKKKKQNKTGCIFLV